MRTNRRPLVLLAALGVQALAVGCGGSSRLGTEDDSAAAGAASGGRGNAPGGSSTGGTSAGVAGTSEGGSSNGGTSAGSMSTGGDAGTGAVAGMVGGGGAGASSGGAPATCPPKNPENRYCRSEGQICDYDIDGCLCLPIAPGPCTKVDKSCTFREARVSPIRNWPYVTCTCTSGAWVCEPMGTGR